MREEFLTGRTKCSFGKGVKLTLRKVGDELGIEVLGTVRCWGGEVGRRKGRVEMEKCRGVD